MRCTLPSSPRRQQGFTLVEVIVVAPLVILVIIGVIAAIVSMTGAAARATALIQLQTEVLEALDMIEQDVKFATEIKSATGGTQLELHNFATSENPLSPNRKLIDPSSCGPAAAHIDPKKAATYWNVYYVSGNSFVRYTRMNPPCSSLSPDIWQKHGQIIQLIGQSNPSFVQEVIEEGGTKKALRIQLTGKRIVAGVEVSYTGHLYVKSLNAR